MSASLPFLVSKVNNSRAVATTANFFCEYIFGFLPVIHLLDGLILFLKMRIGRNQGLYQAFKVGIELQFFVVFNHLFFARFFWGFWLFRFSSLCHEITFYMLAFIL